MPHRHVGRWSPDNLPDSLVRDLRRRRGPAIGFRPAAELIHDNYFRATDPDQVPGLVDQRHGQQIRRQYHDRFSHYFTPKQNEQLSESLQGSFSGVGMTVGANAKKGLEVGYVFRKSPADEAGLESR